MDNKKQANLSPELKEIYDRVMNTSSPQATSSEKGTAPQTTVASPPPPTSPPSSPLSTPPPPAPTAPKMTPPPLPDTPEATPESALSSTPPRAISDIGSKPFSFSGTAKPLAPVKEEVKAEKKEGEENVTEEKKKSSFSMPLLIGLGVLFIAVWGIFWAVLLGIIER